MCDIYRELAKDIYYFKQLDDQALAESSDLYAVGALAISSALTLIGNLASDAVMAEGYSDENARRDLILVSHALSYLPEISRVFIQNSNTAEYVSNQRSEGGEA